MKKCMVLAPFVNDFKSYRKDQVIELDDNLSEQFSKHRLVKVLEEAPEEKIDYSELTVLELKELLTQKNLSTKGKKAILVARLEESDDYENE